MSLARTRQEIRTITKCLCFIAKPSFFRELQAVGREVGKTIENEPRQSPNSVDSVNTARKESCEMELRLAPGACSSQSGLGAGDKVMDIIPELGPNLGVETTRRSSSRSLGR